MARKAKLICCLFSGKKRSSVGSCNFYSRHTDNSTPWFETGEDCSWLSAGSSTSLFCRFPSLLENHVDVEVSSCPSLLQAASLSSQSSLPPFLNSRASTGCCTTQAHPFLVSPNSPLSGIRSAYHHIPLSGTWLLSSMRSPLFLSSPSSLLSQSATPFYSSRDIDLQGKYRKTGVQDVLPGSAHPVCKWQAVSAVGELTYFGSQNWNTCHLQQVDRVGRREETALQGNGWSSRDVFNWPNAISFGRLLSGPFLAWMILQGLSQSALIGLVLAGASDWLDGYIARRKGIISVMGSYLDPLADKVLVGCVALSMAQAGFLHPALVALVISRDAALVGGAFIYRAHSLSWKWNSLKDFFNLGEGGAQKVKPLFVSKVNTVFQLGLVGTALLQPAFGISDTYSLVPLLSWSVAFTTCASWMGYGWKYLLKQPSSSTLAH